MRERGAGTSQLFLDQVESDTEVPLLLSLRTLRDTCTGPISSLECGGEKHISLANISDGAGTPWDFDSPHYPSAHFEVWEG